MRSRGKEKKNKKKQRTAGREFFCYPSALICVLLCRKSRKKRVDVQPAPFLSFFFCQKMRDGRRGRTACLRVCKTSAPAPTARTFSTACRRSILDLHCCCCCWAVILKKATFRCVFVLFLSLWLDICNVLLRHTATHARHAPTRNRPTLWKSHTKSHTPIHKITLTRSLLDWLSAVSRAPLCRKQSVAFASLALSLTHTLDT